MKHLDPPAEQRTEIIRILSLLLRPIARFCVRRSVRLQDLLEAMKKALVDSAEEIIQLEGLQSTTSKLSVMTGVHRRDVVRLQHEEIKSPEESSLLFRIIGQWMSDTRFLTASGSPRKIGYSGKQSEFVHLVRAVSKDVNPYTVLFELERIGAVRKAEEELELVSDIYVPIPGDVGEGLHMLAEDMADLVSGVEENIFDSPRIANLHIKTEYDNICHEFIPEIKNWLLQEGTKFHERARAYLSQYDRDMNPKLKPKEGRVRVAVGAFSRVEHNTLQG